LKGRDSWSHLYGSCDPEFTDCWHHIYYQFVPIVLILQAGAFYFPGFLWETFESERIKNLISGLEKKKGYSAICAVEYSYDSKGKERKDAKLKDKNSDGGKKIMGLINNFIDMKGGCDNWAVKYYFTEVLNLVNVFAQYWFTNAFLGYQFWQVGYVSWASIHELDVTVLPSRATCKFSFQGSGGGLTEFTDSCLLPKNVITQQFYRIWFFWLVFLAIVTCVMMIIRLAIIFDAKTRQVILRHRYNGRKESTKNIIAHCGYGDWLMLSRILDNLPHVFRPPFIEILDKELQGKMC